MKASILLLVLWAKKGYETCICAKSNIQNMFPWLWLHGFPSKRERERERKEKETRSDQKRKGVREAGI
jgi:hypothetical protein